MLQQLARLRENVDKKLTDTYAKFRVAEFNLAKDALPENPTAFDKGMDKFTKGLMVLGGANIAAAPTQVYAIQGMKTKLTSTATTFYSVIDDVITIALCCVVGFCFLAKIFTKNDRKAEVWTAWQQRAAWSWLAFKLLGLFVAYGNELAPGSKTPWTNNGTTP